MSKTTFVIYEKSYLIRKGLVSVIEKIANTQILLQADNEDELFETLDTYDPDFTILNLSEPDNSTFINKISRYKKKTLFISIANSNSYRSPDFISETIYLNDTQSQILKKLNNLIGNTGIHKLKKNLPEEISNREVDILKLIALGLSNKEIADKLFLSTHTVVTHRKNITRKLGIKTVPGLTIYAILNKIIDINEADKL